MEPYRTMEHVIQEINKTLYLSLHDSHIHIFETKEVNFNSDIDVSIRIYFAHTSDIIASSIVIDPRVK